ncbi:MAG: BatA domain-containing protein [Planctomycetaceae bacterium]|nr:BatA domain-containing protein [Planctomycetaceae bacterium]
MTALFFATPLGLVALAVPAAVVWLYLYRRRRQTLAVSGLFLWGRPGPQPTAGNRRERLIHSASFWMDLVAAVLLALAAGGLAWRNDTPVPVVILDDCFAMRSRDNHRDAALAAMALLERSGRGALILAGEQPRLAFGLGGITTDTVERLRADYHPDARRGELSAAVGLARELYGHNVDLHLFTNQTPDATPWDDGCVVHRYAGRGGNVAFGQLWRFRPEPRGTERLAASWHNYADTPQEVIFRIESVGGMVHEEQSTLQPDAVAAVEVNLPRSVGEVIVSLVADQDVVAADSIATLPPAGDDDLGYAVRGLPSEATRFVSLALEAAGMRPSESPHLLVTGRGEDAPALVTVRMVPADEPGVVSPPYAVDGAERLCRDLDLSGTTWVAASPLHPDGVADILVAGGDLPLYWRDEGGELHLNISIEHAPLVGEPSWPILWKNLAVHCRDRVSTEQTISLPLYGEASDTTVLAVNAEITAAESGDGSDGFVRLAPWCLAAAIALLGWNWSRGRRRDAWV